MKIIKRILIEDCIMVFLGIIIGIIIGVTIAWNTAVIKLEGDIKRGTVEMNGKFYKIEEIN